MSDETDRQRPLWTGRLLQRRVRQGRMFDKLKKNAACSGCSVIPKRPRSPIMDCMRCSIGARKVQASVRVMASSLTIIAAWDLSKKYSPKI